MPQLDRVDQLPLPNLSLYAAFSGLALFYAVVYSLTTSRGSFVSTLSSDVWCTAAVLNMGCCGFFLLAKFIHSLVFGAIQRSDHLHLRDKFWNFVFYKFIFVFGVMNVQEVPEMLCWCVWFAVLGTLLLMEQLCKDRFQFLSFSPNTPISAHAKIIVLLSLILLSCAGLFMVCAVVGWQYGFNHFTFLYSEVFIVFAKTLHSIIRHFIHLWDMHHTGVWENRSTYTYYTELFLELAVLSVDFLHHVHMLLWANMLLSVASLILLMKLRFLYQEIQRRLKRHRKYMLVCETMENRFVQVPSTELLLSDESCAICWVKMNTACKLPCGHIFHMVCLRAWLEHDTVCPTCRISLSDDLHQGGRRGVTQGQGREERGGRRLQRNIRNAHNWLFRFNGASIASWLPTFSVELHQEDLHWVNDAEELHRVAQQVQSMFPHVPLQAITLDLVDTHSISLTVDHILTHSIYIPGQDSNTSINTSIRGAGPGLSDTPLGTPEGSSDSDDESFVHAITEQLQDQEERSSSHSSLQLGSDCDSDLGRSQGSHDLKYEHPRHCAPDSVLMSSDAEGKEIPCDVKQASCNSEAISCDLEQVSCDTIETSHDNEQASHDINESQQSISLSYMDPNRQHLMTTGLSRRPRRRLGELERVEEIKELEVKEQEVNTSPSLATHFSSLQERKAELLRRARRRFLSRESQLVRPDSRRS